jgi:hypothetical protein
MSWTQAICADCWDEKYPDRKVRPHQRANVAELERCAYCGNATHLGIYVRDDPAKVPFPRAA